MLAGFIGVATLIKQSWFTKQIISYRHLSVQNSATLILERAACTHLVTKIPTTYYERTISD